MAQWEARLRIEGGGAWRIVASSPTGACALPLRPSRECCRGHPSRSLSAASALRREGVAASTDRAAEGIMRVTTTYF